MLDESSTKEKPTVMQTLSVSFTVSIIIFDAPMTILYNSPRVTPENRNSGAVMNISASSASG